MVFFLRIQKFYHRYILGASSLHVDTQMSECSTLMQIITWKIVEPKDARTRCKRPQSFCDLSDFRFVFIPHWQKRLVSGRCRFQALFNKFCCDTKEPDLFYAKCS